MYLLTTFKRTIGAKDKTKRKRNLAIAGLGALALTGIALANKNKIKNLITKKPITKEVKLLTGNNKKYLVLDMPVHKYDANKLIKDKVYKAEELFTRDSSRTVSNVPILTGKNINKQYKTTKNTKSEYDNRYLNIDITKAPKELIDKLQKNNDSLNKLDSYKELEKLGLLHKNNVKVSRRYKVGSHDGTGFHFKYNKKLNKFNITNILNIFSRKVGSKNKTKRVASTKKLLVKGKKNVKYNGQNYVISKPSKATQKNKKYQVEVTNTTTGKKKTVSWGHKDYTDYLVHKDEKRRDKFQKRFSGIKLKDGSTAANNPMQAAYYATKYNW